MTTEPSSRRGGPARSLILVVLLVLAGLVGAMAWRLFYGRGPAAAQVPEFSLASLDGRRLGPGDYRGQVLLVDFWATWCGPCHVQADILDPLYEEVRGRGVEFLAVSLGEEAEVVRSFLATRTYPYPVLVDPEDRVTEQLGIFVLPTLMILDRQGKVRFLQPGVSDEDTLREALAEAGA